MTNRYEEYDNGFVDNQDNRYFETNKEIIDELNKLNNENEQLKQALEKDIRRRCEIKEAFNERYGDVE